MLLHVLEDALYLGAQGQAVEKLLEGLPGEVFPLDALRLRERHGEEGERHREGGEGNGGGGGGKGGGGGRDRGGRGREKEEREAKSK